MKLSSSPCAAILKNVPRIIGIKFTLRGDESLRANRACVIVSNHQTSLDILGSLLSVNLLFDSQLMICLSISGMFGECVVDCAYLFCLTFFIA
jgi:hypothetical protein